MEEHQPDARKGKSAGRGIDLFFGDDAAEDADERPAESPGQADSPETSPSIAAHIEAPSRNDDISPQPADVHTDHAEPSPQLTAPAPDGTTTSAARPPAGDAIAAEAGEASSPAIEETSGISEDVVQGREVPAIAAEPTQDGTTVAQGGIAAAASVGELPVVGMEPKTPPPPAGPATAAAGSPPPVVMESAQAVGRSATVWLVLLAGILGAVLALLVLLIINGNLTWAPKSILPALRGEITGVSNAQDKLKDELDTMGANLTSVNGSVQDLQNQVEALASLESDVNEAQQRLNALETNSANMQADLDAMAVDLDDLSRNVDQVATEVNTLADDLNAVADEVNGLNQDVTSLGEDVNTLSDRMDEVAASAARSDAFLAGMRDLLTQILGESAVITSTAAISGSQVITATGPITVTAPLTATSTITATPVLTATAPVTASEAVTETLPATATVPLTPTVPVTGTSAPVPTEIGRIRGMVFVDSNLNGRRDAGEAGIEGVMLTLYDRDRSELANTTSDAEGEYGFAGLAPGRYLVVESDLEGFRSSTLNAITVILGPSGVAVVDFGDYQFEQ